MGEAALILSNVPRDPLCATEAADPTTGKAVSSDLAGHVTLPVFLRRTATTRRLGMETLCLTGLCWVEDGRVRLQRFHEKAGLGRRLRNAEGYPYDLLSPEGVEYARSRWSECASSVERWHRQERDGRAAQAGDSLDRVPSTASTADKVAFLKKEHPELKQQEIAKVLGVSLRTVERCSAGLRKRSRVVGRTVSYTALEPATKNSGCVAEKSQSRRVSPVDGSVSGSPDYDPAEDITHDTYPDGRPCVVEGFPFDLDNALKESLQRPAAKAKEPAPPRPASPRYDALRPRLFTPAHEASLEEAWRALEVFRVHRHGATCTAMELAFILDHFPTVPAKGVAEMVGVSASTVRRHRAKRRT